MDAGKSRRIQRLCTGVILFGLAVAVVVLRLYRLAELPPGLFLDEGVHGVDALQVLQGKHAVFFRENTGREGLIVYAIALATSFLGRTILAIRLPTALASAGTVFVIFWLGQLLFGKDEESGQASPWRGLLIGAVGASLLAVSIGQTVIGRTAFRGNFLPLLLSLTLALLWAGWMRRSWWRIALAGACAGALPYTYIPARFTPFLFLLFGLSFALPFRSVTRERVQAELPWAGAFVGVAGLVAAPILVHFALHPEDFFIRSSQIWVFHPVHSHGDPLAAFLGNVWDHLLVFGFHGDRSWRHNFAGQPMLNPWEAFFFWFGVGMALWRWQRPAYRLLLLWLGSLILPALLAREAAPNTLRMIGAAPAIYLLIAVGLWEAFQLLTSLSIWPWQNASWERRRDARHRFFQENNTKSAIAVGAMVGGLLLGQGMNTYRAYFQKWAAAPESLWEYEAEWMELLRVVNAQPPNPDIVYLIPDGHRHQGLHEEFRSYSFDFLYPGATPVYFFHTAMPNPVQKMQAALAAMENLSTVKVVDWNSNIHWTGDEGARLGILFGNYSRYLSSETYDYFQIHNYTDILLDRPWMLYEHLEPLTVLYDGGIALQGLALGQGAERLSSQQLLSLGPERVLWLALQWQTIAGLDIDYSISLRLYNAEGGWDYQRDIVIWKPDHKSTGLGEEAELFDTLVQLAFPSDVPPGDYELRMVVYNIETLTPTVQEGVWKPDVTLARLRLQ